MKKIELPKSYDIGIVQRANEVIQRETYENIVCKKINEKRLVLYGDAKVLRKRQLIELLMQNGIKVIDTGKNEITVGGSRVSIETRYSEIRGQKLTYTKFIVGLQPLVEVNGVRKRVTIWDFDEKIESMVQDRTRRVRRLDGALR